MMCRLETSHKPDVELRNVVISDCRNQLCVNEVIAREVDSCDGSRCLQEQELGILKQRNRPLRLFELRKA